VAQSAGRSLAIIAALVGGLYVVADAQQQPKRAPAAITAAPVTAAAPRPAVRRKAIERKTRTRPAALPNVRAPRAIIAPEKKRPAATKRGGDPVCARARRERAQLMAMPLTDRIAEGARRIANSGMSMSEINEIRRRCGV